MAHPPIFSFFSYAKNLTEMLRDTFPKLKEVSFPPTTEGFTDSRFGDVALPAFLINFEDPELLPMAVQSLRHGEEHSEELESDDIYFMPLKIRLAGYVLMPVFPEANSGVANVNATVLLAQVASNIAAKIHADARGEDWNCSVASINQLNFIDDSITDEERNYHVAEIHWSHDVWVGSLPEQTLFEPATVFNRFTIPEDGETPDDSHEVYPDRGDPEP